MHLNTCIVDMPEDYAYGKYSFFYIFYRNPVFWNGVFLYSVWENYFALGLEIYNSSFKVLMWLYAFISYVKLHPLFILPLV